MVWEPDRLRAGLDRRTLESRAVEGVLAAAETELERLRVEHASEVAEMDQNHRRVTADLHTELAAVKTDRDNAVEHMLWYTSTEVVDDSVS